MAFTFTPEQREALLLALGRDDNSAWYLTEDVEVAIAAYGSASVIPGKAALTDELTRLLEKIRALRSALYPLPEQLRLSGLVGELDAERLSAARRDADRIGESLDRFYLALIDLRSRLAVANQVTGTPAERFLHALGQAYRNRMNIRPTAAQDAPFRRFHDAVLELIRRRFSDLDELCSGLDEDRLNRILEFAHS